MAFIILALILLLLLPDLYIWLSFVRGSNLPLLLTVAYWLPTLLALGILGLAATGNYTEWLFKLFFGLLLCIALPKLLFTLVSLLGRATELLVPGAYTAGNLIGLVVALTTSAACCYGFASGWKKLNVQSLTVQSDKLPAAFDGYRILHFSDLHLGTYGQDTRFVQTVVDRIQALNPHLIVFTGDLVNSTAEELYPHEAVLSQLHAPDGVFSVLGNHDYCLYRRYDTPDGAARNLDTLKHHQQAMGWQLLLNEHRLIRRGTSVIALVGVENDSKPPFPSRGDLTKAMQGLPAETFKVLLTHDPSHWRREVLAIPDAPDLTLSGHTHAMQLQWGNHSPAALAYREWGGLYREQEASLYVSTGVGGSVPFRLGAWPQLTLITRKRGNTP